MVAMKNIKRDKYLLYCKITLTPELTLQHQFLSAWNTKITQSHKEITAAMQFHLARFTFFTNTTRARGAGSQK